MRCHRSILSRCLPAVAALTVAAPALHGLTGAPGGDPATTPTPISAEPVGPGGAPIVERQVAGDMVVDWLEEPPAGADEWLAGQHDAHDHEGEEADDHDGHESHDEDGDDHAGDDADHEGHEHERHEEGDGTRSPTAAASTTEAYAPAATPGHGFAVFAAGPRLLRTGYTIRLAGPDSRIEQYRDELTTAARNAAAATGLPVRVAAGRGGSVNPSRGEIVAVVGEGPCGAGAAGCGGPTFTSTEVVAGRIWIAPPGLTTSPANRVNLAAHELGHALGLQHYSGSWTDGRQAMHPVVSGLTTYRAGDTTGLRYMAGAFDRAAGTVSSRTYAAGQMRVTGSLASGTRVRVTVGSTSRDATASGGRFDAAVPAGAGSHQVCVTSLDAGAGYRRDLGCATVTAPGAPQGRFEGASDSFETVRLTGWALDPQTAAPVSVQVRRNGTLVTTAAADRNRPDVASAQPAYGAAHGFDLQVPAVAGSNELCVRVLGVGAGGDKDLGCRTVTHAVDPIGVFERADVSDLGVTISGWALDPNTPSAVEVRITVNGSAPAALESFRADRARSDVGRRYPTHGANHGFSQRLTLAPGHHEVCLTVRNVGLGRDQALGCAPVHVRSASGAADAAASEAPRGLVPALPGVDGVDGLVGGVVGTVTGTLDGLTGG